MTPILYSSNLRQSALFYNGALGLYVTEHEGGLVAMNNQVKLLIKHAERSRYLPKLDVIIQVFDAERLHCQLQLRRMPGMNLPILRDGATPRFSVSDPDGNTVHYVEKRPVRPITVRKSITGPENLVTLNTASVVHAIQDVSCTALPPA